MQESNFFIVDLLCVSTRMLDLKTDVNLFLVQPTEPCSSALIRRSDPYSGRPLSHDDTQRVDSSQSSHTLYTLRVRLFGMENKESPKGPATLYTSLSGPYGTFRFTYFGFLTLFGFEIMRIAKWSAYPYISK